MKSKIFTAVVLFASLALVACGKAEEPSSSSKHTHKWVQDTTKTNVEATCKEEGIKYEVCSICGEKRENKTAKADHTYDAGVASGKCGEAGEIVYTCTVCGNTKKETSGLIPHNWDLANAQTVPASNGGVEYTTAECKTCHAKGYFVAAEKAEITNPSGKAKKDAPEGCVKLGGDGDYMTVSFNLDAAKTGVFWLRGSMDYWYEDSNNNQNKTYYSENNGHTDSSTKTGNFKLEVGADAEHLVNVELPDNTALTFADMLPEEGGSSYGGHNWSVVGDCIVGAASLEAGLNMIKFTRVDSYNLAVHDFLFVVPAAA